MESNDTTCKIFSLEAKRLKKNQYLFVEFTPDLTRVSVAQSLVFCVILCRSMFVILFYLHLIIVLSVLLWSTGMASYYPFSTSKNSSYGSLSILSILKNVHIFI